MNPRSLSPFGGPYGGDPFFSLQRDMNRLFDDALRGFGAASTSRQSQAGGSVEARMNVSETENELRISAELPGVDEKDVEVTLEGDVLTIRGEKKFEEERGDKKENYHFVERSYGSFQRSVQLPYSVKAEDVSAEFRNGVLTLTLPKSEQQQRRTIPIGAASAQQQIEHGRTTGEPQDKRQPGRGGTGEGEQPARH
jgi:HSP20 family protein